MREFTIKLPIYLETGVRKKRKHYLNLNLYRNTPFHQNNSLKRAMKDVIFPLVPEEFWGIKLQNYEIDYELYLPNRLKRDISNVLSIVDKFSCDALVDCGVLQDDNYEHLKKVTYRFGGFDEAKKGYVLMTIKETE
jgi:hypothetical protein